MSDYVKPFLSDKPKEIIIHVGNNDLNSSPPKKIAEEIIQLDSKIKKLSPGTKVAFSSLTMRTDEEALIPKLKETIAYLKLLLYRNNFSFISHDNIDSSCLNRDMVHLNKKGTSIFARNIINHLRNDH